MQKTVPVTEAWARKYPEQVVLAVTRNAEGRVNLMAAGWVCTVSEQPPMFLVGIDENAYTLELIRARKEFVIAYPGADMARAVLYCGTVHGHDEDKGAQCGLRFADADRIGVPLVADAVANFECRLVGIFRPGDCPLVVGEIVAAHVNADAAAGRLFNLGPGHRLGGVGRPE